MPSFKEHAKCYMEIDKQIAVEYNTIEDGNTITSYVEAKSNAPYTLEVEFKRQEAIRVDYELYLDGILQGAWTGLTGRSTISGRSIYCGGNTIKVHEFKFGDIQTLHNKIPIGLAETRPNVRDDIGTVVLKVFRSKKHVKRSRRRVETNLNQPKMFDEKTIKGKGVTHQTTFSEPKIHKSSGHVWRTERIDKSPFVIFKFICISRATLQCLKLIPEVKGHDAIVEAGADRDDIKHIKDEPDDGIDHISHKEAGAVLHQIKQEKNVAAPPQTIKKEEGKQSTTLGFNIKNEKVEALRLTKRKAMTESPKQPERRKKRKVREVIVLSDSD